MRERKYTPESIGRDDPNFTKSTKFYMNMLAAREGGRVGVYAAITDTGAANAMGPSLELLAGRDAIRVLAREAGADAIEVHVPALVSDMRSVHPSTRLERMSADVVFTGMASNPTLELLTHKAANEKQKPVVAIEDYPMAYGAELKGLLVVPQLRPSRLMVMSEAARQSNLKDLPWLDPDHVLVTGQPAFDYIATEDRAAIKSNVYERAGIDTSDKLVVWMGQKGGTREAFEMFVDGLSQISEDFRLVIRRHPRDVVQMEEYEDLAGPLKARLVRTDGIPTSEVGAAGILLQQFFLLRDYLP
jgi:hypothetical protein